MNTEQLRQDQVLQTRLLIDKDDTIQTLQDQVVFWRILAAGLLVGIVVLVCLWP